MPIAKIMCPLYCDMSMIGTISNTAWGMLVRSANSPNFPPVPPRFPIPPPFPQVPPPFPQGGAFSAVQLFGHLAGVMLRY